MIPPCFCLSRPATAISPLCSICRAQIIHGSRVRSKIWNKKSSPLGTLKGPGEVSSASQFPSDFPPCPPPCCPLPPLTCFPPAVPQLVSGSPPPPPPPQQKEAAVGLVLLPPYSHPRACYMPLLLLRFHCSVQLLPKISDRNNRVIACSENVG